MTDRSNRRRRGLMLSASAAAILALTVGSAAHADCAAEMAALEQEIQAAEAAHPSAEGREQQATAQPEQPAESGDQQATAQPEQPAESGDQQATAQPEQPAESGDQQQAMDEPEQPTASGDQHQATAQPEQPAESTDQRQAMTQPDPQLPAQQQAEAPRLEEGTVRQQGMPRANEMQAVRPPEGATIAGQPGEAATGAQPGAMGPTGDQTAERTGEDAQAQEQQTATAQQQPSASHPLVLQMADGSVVDMRPPEEKEEASAPAADQPAATEGQAGQQPASAGQQQAEAAGREAEEGAEPVQPAATHGPAPAESLWFTSEATVLAVEASLDEAKAALQQGNEEACMEAIQEARASIEEFNMSGEEGQSSAPQQPERGGTAPR